METYVTFETYVYLKDGDEIKAEVSAVGEVIDVGFSHEFGYESGSSVEDTWITSIVNLSNDDLIEPDMLSKKEIARLVSQAEEYILEKEFDETYEAYYD